MTTKPNAVANGPCPRVRERGDLRAVNVTPGSSVSGDVDGDKHADFSIQVADVSHLHARDFIL